MIPLGVLASARAEAAGGSPLALSYITTASINAIQQVWTFSGVSIGTASAGRYVVVAVGGTSTVSRWVTGVTIGGVEATLDAAPAVLGSVTAIARAAVPTGATADIVVTYSGGVYRTGIGVWTLTGAHTASGASGTSSATVTGATGGVIVASAAVDNKSAFSWTTNATERYDYIISNQFTAVSGADSTATGTVTVEITSTGATGLSVVAYAPA